MAAACSGLISSFLAVAHPVEQRAWRELLRVEVLVSGDQCHQPLRVGVVVDREGLPVAERVDLGPQDAHACGVEGGDPHHPRPVAHQFDDPGAHLGGRLVGERDGQDRARVHFAFPHQVGDPSRQDAGLARTCAGDHEHRATGVHHRRSLRLVQAVHQARCARTGGPGAGGGGAERGEKVWLTHGLPTISARPRPSAARPRASVDTLSPPGSNEQVFQLQSPAR